MGTSLKDLRNLLEKFLQWERDDSGKHIRYRFIVNGRTVAETHYSHSWSGNQQIDNKMLMKMASEMRCSLGTLKSLLQGKASKKDYYEELFKPAISAKKNILIFAEKQTLLQKSDYACLTMSVLSI